ncbi:hypothetical protein H6G54_26440 [Anabaena cylindrica FACHB-243]|uniref:Uncharacterized protein n=1 Tax=Anabaena cylindrica (strain ATCC 27899 / PCC 7122) TaxID=272123 RepID=K9ZGI5_ANACC|nr:MULTISPECIES: hypothetical protein [Anabaena]AFZ57480.1 hypothetical protein Anacy_1996 [Anabaena cylindrica PCC 7122]MBD2421164.1 hypothetical protein [Anabaena cylindrica FACHB-243]MBY5281129.1 hypothetical protein [Anabaena sp. CCAP 1446/1C]MBY5308539.1 hypothetical protein [Anabaena sp. CCAP 1446/1C]MCM2405919.1 hypothetical protein [Anabaena sp. CCAP 1446/1C]
MKLKIKSKVDADGKLLLQLPQYLANQELVIIISDVSEEKIPTPEELGYAADFFEKTAGKWEGEVLVRENLFDCDRRVWDIEE